MGRRAKYNTLVARQEAKQAQAKSYRESAKGKETKSRSNRRQYAHQSALTRAAHELLTTLPHAFIIPRAQRMRAQSHMRASFTVLDEGPLLGLWTPPYHFEPPGALEGRAIDIRDAWNDRAATLRSFQYGQIIDAGWTRAARWKSLAETEAVLCAEVEGELTARINAWTALNEAGNGDDEDARQLALDWGARIVTQLAEEWECRTKGVDMYADAHRDGRLPWQRMIKDMMTLYANEN
ncbi:hypothetical protein C8Q76DRAFT_790736 [Earliella scabrosa]|nr:hypothetical protein C8Q76DRAFT_790736 [Earliella scabrosa]